MRRAKRAKEYGFTAGKMECNSMSAWISTMRSSSCDGPSIMKLV